MVGTTHEKEAALREFEERKKKNVGRPRKNNAALHAGSPMYFDCGACQDEMSFPETFVTRDEYCSKCQGIIDKGWLDPKTL